MLQEYSLRRKPVKGNGTQERRAVDIFAGIISVFAGCLTELIIAGGRRLEACRA